MARGQHGKGGAVSEPERLPDPETAGSTAAPADAGTNVDRRGSARRDTVPVPRSNAVVEPISLGATGLHRAVVRCGSCDRRAFDVVGLPSDIAPQAAAPFGVLHVTRRCRRCDRLQDGPVTGRSGYPLPDGLAGLWRCECGHVLGVVAEVRGRVKVRCRCGLELRATAADVIETAEAAVIADAS